MDKTISLFTRSWLIYPYLSVFFSFFGGGVFFSFPFLPSIPFSLRRKKTSKKHNGNKESNKDYSRGILSFTLFFKHIKSYIDWMSFFRHFARESEGGGGKGRGREGGKKGGGSFITYS